MNAWIVRLRAMLAQPRFFGLLLTTVALGFGFSFVNPVMSLWGTTYVHLSASMFGLYMTATGLAMVFLSTSLARWSDTHVPRKVMLLLGGGGGIVGYTCYALLRDPRILIFVAVTAIALTALCISQLFAHVRDHFVAVEIPGVEKGLPVSLVRGCFSLAWTVGPSFGAWMQIGYGFPGLFLGAAGLFLLFVVGVLLWVPYQPHPPHARKAAREPVLQVLTQGHVLAASVAFFLAYASQSMDMLNLPLLITHELHGTARDIGIAYGVGPIFEVPLMLWFGYLASRGHQLRLLRVGALIAIAYYLMLYFAAAPWHVYVARALSGALIAVISNIGILFFQDMIPGQAGLATTAFYNAANCGSLAGYLAFSAVVSVGGHRGIALLASGLSAGMGLIFVFYRHRNEGGDLDPSAGPPPVPTAETAG